MSQSRYTARLASRSTKSNSDSRKDSPGVAFAPWRKGLEVFRFLPIRIKLSLIIAAIVIVVLSAFSLLILSAQKLALMDRANQVCNVLLKNLAETSKGDLLMNEIDKVTEAVYRLQKTSVEGLESVAILDRNAKKVVAFDINGEVINFENQRQILKIESFTVREQGSHFEYFYPIKHRFQENNDVKEITLGYAFIRFSKESILFPIRNARDIAIGSALLVTLFAILVINLIARKMAEQIQLLSDGARAVGAGNLDVEISIKSKDELGQLAAEFNNMIQHLREKLQMQKFVSKLTVQMIKDTVNTDGKQSNAVNQKVTVLFSDIRDFSSIAEKLKPQEIVKLINIYFDLQTRIIESHQGIVDKFMGDQIMAIFQGKTMADDALRAAVEIQRQIRFLNQERMAKGEATLETGIGINNGSAVMGNMGSANRMDYTVIGDVVNVAARLCSKASAGQVIMSYELAKRVNGTYPTSRLKSISVKGRTKEIDVCEVDYNREILT